MACMGDSDNSLRRKFRKKMLDPSFPDDRYRSTSDQMVEELKKVQLILIKMNDNLERILNRLNGPIY